MTGDDVVVLGRISGVYGVKGWVRIFSYTDPMEGILDYDEWLLGSGSRWNRIARREGRRQGKGLVASLVGTDDRDAAALLVGTEIGVLRADLPDPGADSYYWKDLEGLAVQQVDGNVVGTVDHLLQTGANDVLVVRGEAETLIPFLPGTVVKNVDLDRGVITIDWEWE